MGAGFGRRLVVPILRAVPPFEVVALVSGSLERARAVANELGIPNAFPASQLEPAMAEADLVFIASPPAAHRDQSLLALSSGKHVVCEKPTALDAVQASEMLAASQRSNRLALIDHELRFSPVRRRFRDLARQGFLGRLRHADLVIQGEYRLDKTRPWSWWSDRAQGGGFLGAVGSHAIDAVRYMVSEIEAARGLLRTIVDRRPAPDTGELRTVTSDDYALFWLKLEEDATLAATLSAVARAPRDTWRLAVHGEDGSLLLDEKERLWGRRQAESEYRDLTPADPGADAAALGVRDSAWTRAFLIFARELGAALASGRTTLPDAATFEDGLRVQQVMDAIRESSHREPWVECGATPLAARRR